MTNDIRFGDWVICDAYIIKSGKSISVADEGCPMIYDSVTDTATKIEAEYHPSVKRYHTKQHRFIGIYVGTTTKATRIIARYCEDTYTSGWRVSTDTPQTFAVVYYGNNKKRYVPLDKLRKQENRR